MRLFGERSSQGKGKRNACKSRKNASELDPIPLSYTELFLKLLEKGLIEPIRLPSLRPPFPKWYKADARCDYHAGNPGYSLENCTTLKYKAQELIQEIGRAHV